jgi:2-keto-3-deoxy-L-rhamnonate aldolase RhmA
MDDVFTDAEGRPRRIRGVTINSGSTLLVGLAAQVGFEAIWIEVEHGPAGFERIENLCLAAEAGGVLPIVRLPDGERHHVLRALEVGARIILVPMVDDEAQAGRIVEYGKYPPLGRRGFNTRTRGIGFGLVPPAEAFARANARTHLFTQIETLKAVESLDEICAVEGLSGVFIGPGDLSMSMGYLGQPNHPAVVETVLECMRRAREAGKLTGIFITPGPLLDAAVEAGCALVVCGGDVMDLAAAWTNLLEAVPVEVRDAKG